MRGDLDLRDIRGNVDTRLAKVHTGEYDAIVLAAAGLERLGLSGRITEVFSVEEMVPDAGQGIIAVQARTGDVFGALAGEIDDGASRVAAVAERAIVRALNAGCRSPVGAHCLVDGARIRLIAMAAHDDGSDFRRAETTGAAADAEPLGGALGARLLGEIEA
jgi:hydroxymethylbilane synthase